MVGETDEYKPDPEALKFEEKIFLRSEKGRVLFALLVNGLPKEATPFNKVTVRYDNLFNSWTISGYVLKTNMVYSLSVTGEELKYRV